MNHVEPELLAAFAEGKLQDRELIAVSDHLRECADCRKTVGETVRFLREESPARAVRPRRIWLAAAAMIMVAIAGAIVWVARDRSPMHQLIAAAPRDVRFIEPRLTGFPAAPLATVVRGVENDPRQMQLTGAAGRVLQQTSGDTSPDAVHAAAVAQLLTAQPSRAIAALKAAAEKSGSAAMWSDLAAASYVAAAQDPSQLMSALAAADQALRIDPSMKEALFNRALILTQLAMKDAAVKAWNRYLEIEPDGPFAAEARQHLQMLNRARLAFPDAIERQIASFARGNRAAASPILAADAGELRTFAETDLLARWGEATLRGDAPGARVHLDAARTAGAAIAAFNGEPMVADAVAAIDSADEESRRTLARAHVTYRDGRRAYRPLRKPKESERLLLEASEAFRGRSPMELVARTYTGVAIFGQSRIDEAHAMFQELARAVPAKYKALAAYVRWQRASYAMSRGAWTESIDDLLSAIAVYEQLNERSTAAYVHDIVSQVYDLIGDRERAWQHRVVALRELGARPNHRLEHAIQGIVYDALKRKEWREAASFTDLQMDVSRQVQDKEMQAHLHLRRALVASRLGDTAGADANLAAGRVVVASVEDAALRRRLEVENMSATALLATQPAAAVTLLSNALRFHDQNGWRVLMPDLYLQRGRMHRQLGDEAHAAEDFEAGIVELERERAAVQAGEQRWGVFDTSAELFEEAIDLALQSEPARAFEYAERQTDTPGRFDAAAIPDDAAVVRYIALPEKLVVFVAGRRGVVAKQVNVTRAELLTRIEQFASRVRAGTIDDQQLGNLLVPAIDATDLIIVPDRYTAQVPFAALRIAGKPLIEKHALTIGPNARLCLQSRAREKQSPRVTALVIDNPASADMSPLAYARAEADAIQSLYPQVQRLSGRDATAEAFLRHAPQAEIIHFAGHGIASGATASLELASTEDRSGSVDSRTISRLPLTRTHVVVLAACDSAKAPARAVSSVLSVGYAFLEAGAPAVIATLWPISDRDAADFFPRLHRHLARGERASQALWHAQNECIRDAECNRNGMWAAVQALGS